MKILLYVRQAFALIKEDKQFSFIYIAGTAVAIASAMVVALVLHIRMGNIYPEVNRDRTIYVGSNFTRSDGEYIGYSGYSPQAVEEMFSKLECAEVVSAGVNNEYIYNFTACKEVGKQEVPVCIKFVDPNFFRLYEFKFLEGKPYNEENLKNADRCIVITDALAKKLQAGSGLVEQTILLNYLPYRVVGVVKEVSPLLQETSADIYMPYTVQDQWAGLQGDKVSYAGSLEVRVLLKKGYTREMLMDELEPYRAKYLSMLKSTTGEDWNWYIQVRPHWRKVLNYFGEEVNDASMTDRDGHPQSVWSQEASAAERGDTGESGADALWRHSGLSALLAVHHSRAQQCRVPVALQSRGGSCGECVVAVGHVLHPHTLPHRLRLLCCAQPDGCPHPSMEITQETHC